jgi:hypothetical protein
MGTDWSLCLTHNKTILPLVRASVNFKNDLTYRVSLPLTAPA